MGGCRQLFYHYMNNKAKANREEMGPKLSSIRHQELVSITDPGSNLGVPSEQASSFSSSQQNILTMQVSGVAPGFVGPEAYTIWESSQKKNKKLKMHNQVQM